MQYMNGIVQEVIATGNKIDEQQVANLVNEIEAAKHIFLAGAGRSGLMIRAFANRLLHLGYSVSLVGEISSPNTKAGDLFIIGSASGTTTSLVNQATIAKKNGVKIGLITTNPNASLGETATLQPMGSLFEQTSLFLYDSIIMYLMQKNGETNQTMSKRHADLE